MKKQFMIYWERRGPSGSAMQSRVVEAVSMQEALTIGLELGKVDGWVLTMIQRMDELQEGES